MLPITRQSRYGAFDPDNVSQKNLTFGPCTPHFVRSRGGNPQQYGQQILGELLLFLGIEPGMVPVRPEFKGSAPDTATLDTKPEALVWVLKATQFVCLLESGLFSGSGLLVS